MRKLAWSMTRPDKKGPITLEIAVLNASQLKTCRSSVWFVAMRPVWRCKAINALLAAPPIIRAEKQRTGKIGKAAARAALATAQMILIATGR